MRLDVYSNKLRQNISELKKAGFHVWDDYKNIWATHPKLLYQYCVKTMANEAIKDLREKEKQTETQLKLF